MMERWERACATCGVSFQGNDKACYCKPCTRARWNANRAKRQAEGRLKPCAKMPREYHQQYGATYKTRPEVKQANRERARLRLTDPTERQKADVRQLTRNAIRRGELLRQPCERCGCTTVDAHHDDYSEPLQVRWLCRIHHREHHLKATGETK